METVIAVDVLRRGGVEVVHDHWLLKFSVL
jgi:hypothetical protein